MLRIRTTKHAKYDQLKFQLITVWDQLKVLCARTGKTFGVMKVDTYAAEHGPVASVIHYDVFDFKQLVAYGNIPEIVPATDIWGKIGAILSETNKVERKKYSDRERVIWEKGHFQTEIFVSPFLHPYEHRARSITATRLFAALDHLQKLIAKNNISAGNCVTSENHEAFCLQLTRYSQTVKRLAKALSEFRCLAKGEQSIVSTLAAMADLFVFLPLPPELFVVVTRNLGELYLPLRGKEPVGPFSQKRAIQFFNSVDKIHALRNLRVMVKETDVANFAARIRDNGQFTQPFYLEAFTVGLLSEQRKAAQRLTFQAVKYKAQQKNQKSTQDALTFLDSILAKDTDVCKLLSYRGRGLRSLIPGINHVDRLRKFGETLRGSVSDRRERGVTRKNQ